MHVYVLPAQTSRPILNPVCFVFPAGKYLKREVLNLARFISVAKFRPLIWRTQHPYLLADRFEVSEGFPNSMNHVISG